MAPSMPFTVNKISETGAAEIIGLDWSRIDEPEIFAAFKRAFLENPILAVRNSKLTPKQQVAFSRKLGSLEHNDTRKDLTHADDPDVLILSNEIAKDGAAVGVVDAGEEWHSDLSYQPAPAYATILQLIKRPSCGGDTEFCNLYNVYDAVPGDLKKRINGLNGVHHLSKLRNPRVTISANRPGAAEYYARVNDDKLGSVQPIVRTSSRERTSGPLHLAAIYHRHRRNGRLRGSTSAGRVVRIHGRQEIPISAQVAGR